MHSLSFVPKSLLIIGIAVINATATAAEPDTITARFACGASVILNRDSIERVLESNHYEGTIMIIGGASPEGPDRLNHALSRRRAESLKRHISSSIDTTAISTLHLGADWDGLVALMNGDASLPSRPDAITAARGHDMRTLRLLDGGKVYEYIAQHYFPYLRRASVVLKVPVYQPSYCCPQSAEAFKQDVQLSESCPDRIRVRQEKSQRPFYMAVCTNMLYDALLVPNLGLEFYLGKQWSIGAEGMYAWWSRRSRARYWRIYGGELSLRRYFGKEAIRKPLSGHHLGLIGAVFTYDFEMGGEGEMGGEPGGTLLDRCNYTVGVEYGYQMPISRHLCMDFSIGVGYWGGKYIKYRPDGDCFVPSGTYRRHYFGPVEAAVSLVWLTGHGNVNLPKERSKR